MTEHPTRDMVQVVAKALCPYKTRPCPGAACEVCVQSAKKLFSTIEDYQLVPVEPTEAMLSQPTKYDVGDEWDSRTEMMPQYLKREVYSAMLSAAPRMDSDQQQQEGGWRPNWADVYKGSVHTPDRDQELLTVTRHTLHMALSALKDVMAQDYYDNYGAAAQEIKTLLALPAPPDSVCHSTTRRSDLPSENK